MQLHDGLVMEAFKAGDLAICPSAVQSVPERIVDFFYCVHFTSGLMNHLPHLSVGSLPDFLH